MIKQITVAQNITYAEVNAIMELTDVFNPSRSHVYKGLGFSNPGIVNAKPFENKHNYKRLYLLSFIVDPTIYMDRYNNIDIDSITAELNKITNNKYYQNLPWIIEQIKMKQTINNAYADNYVKLLNMGNPLDSISMDKTADNKRSPSDLKYSSIGADLEIKSSNGSELYAELYLKQPKLKDMFGSRQIEMLRGNSADFEKSMWEYYFRQLSGKGDYYAYDKADDLISKSGKTKKLKERYRVLLKCVAYYKGMERFLNHVGKPDPHFNDVEYFKDKETVLRDIHGLESIGINPVTISRRMSIDNLPNIIDLIV